MSENRRRARLQDIAGIAEHVLRDCGSEFAWTFTGGQEIASGHRSWTGACTPATRKLVQRGEFLVLDLHGMYGLMLGDVSHNAVLGAPTPEQQRVIDAYVRTCEFLLAAMRPGKTIGAVAAPKTAQNDCAAKMFCPRTKYIPPTR